MALIYKTEIKLDLDKILKEIPLDELIKIVIARQDDLVEEDLDELISIYSDEYIQHEFYFRFSERIEI